MAKPPRGAEAGIVIKADHVDLDLGGFALVGAEGSSVGVVASLPEKRDALYDVCVHGGSLVQWGGSGLDLSVVQGARVDAVHVTGTGTPKVASSGLRVGTAAVVRDCTAIGNVGAGIVAGSASVVSDCLSDRNGLDGFALAGQVTARQCSATRNGHAGFLLDGALCMLVDCSATGNGAEGVHTTETASVRDCDASGNLSSGFALGSGSSIRGCLASRNRGAGVSIFGSQCRVEDNHLVDNGSPLSVEGGVSAVVGNTLTAAAITDELALASLPGGVFVPTGSSPTITLSGIGSLRPMRIGSPALDAALEKDGGPLEPWANILVQ
jgi:hypothetical protein